MSIFSRMFRINNYQRPTMPRHTTIGTLHFATNDERHLQMCRPPIPKAMLAEIKTAIFSINSTNPMREIAERWLAGTIAGVEGDTFSLGNFLYDWDRRVGRVDLALPLLERAAIMGNSDADVVLGFYARRGIGGHMDLRTAEKRFRAAAERNNPRGMLELGESLTMGLFGCGRVDEGMPWLIQAAMGDPELSHQAQVSILQAISLASLDKIPRYLIEMDSWIGDWLRIRDDAYVAGLFALFSRCSYGSGSSEDGIRHLERAAGSGTVIAAHLLARLHQEGVKVLQCFITAHAWFNIAAAAGFPPSEDCREAIASRMMSEQVAAAQHLAASLRRQLSGMAT